MRDLVFFIAMVFFLPLAITNAFIGFLLWGWSGLIGVNYYIFGFMSNIGYTQFFALITLFALFFFKEKIKKFHYPVNRIAIFIVIFALHGLVFDLLAYS